MPDDALRAGGSMWLDALLYDSGQGEAELLIVDEVHQIGDVAPREAEMDRRVL
jgi:hypothetical protein